MRELAFTYLNLFRSGVVLMVLLAWSAESALAQYPVLKRMKIQDNPLAVEFEVTGRPTVKVIQISSREVLIAMRNVSLAKGFRVEGKKVGNTVNVEQLDGNVVAVVMASKTPYGKIGSSFNKANTRLTVSLGPVPKAPVPAPAKPAPPAPAAKEKAETRPLKPEPSQGAAKSEPRGEAPRPAPEPEPPPQAESAKEAKAPAPAKAGGAVGKAVAAPPVYLPPKRAKGEYLGDIGDLLRGANLGECEAKPVQDALVLMKRALYREAYASLDQYVTQENFSCLELVQFLRAFAHLKGLGEDDIPGLMASERMFQDALISYPKSRYLPFGYAALGMIQVALKNMAAAEGYFNIVAQGYKDYTGMPEVHYHLARIYDEKGYTDKALNLYQQVFQSPLDHSYITDAGVGYGKALYDKQRYFDALSIFDFVIKNDVKKVYASPDLLNYTANANFELGLTTGARDHYTRLLNLFPDVRDRDVVLSRVGDTYSLENNQAKAVKIYELVRERYPDSPGFISASIGLARYLETDQEKIEVYEMIKARFPDNTYARIAMMRLAEIYQKNGEYTKCIQEIEDLLSTHPRGLRYEAVKLMQKAYEALFKQQLKDDEYTKVLNRYELEHTKIDKMSSRLIAFRVGMAYLEADLYEEAFNHLLTAYKQFKRSERTAELLFGLGRAMDESGRDEDALKLYDALVQRFPKDPSLGEALTRTGRIHLEKNRFKAADLALAKALDQTRDPLVRGEIFMLRAQAHVQGGDLGQAAALKERAIKAYVAAPGQNYEVLAESYKSLGTTYLALNAFALAAESFAKALNFSQGDRARANLGFLLGDAYQKGNVLDKAKEAFEQVAQSYDSVWARLAQQRLSTLSLAENAINS